ncbi:unnamed protein product [Brassicogethes aeneus]|uniref:Coiled-coil domain-containing protein 137 n=1 Tax=Brassicogethes aeneus TaxID=1431903 RepID=A0A9P0BHV2_BRAAE|nr:unnamed protein product [Brassicogethes aeneus]
MGRKIPGRKHHGVRDPEKQAAVRFDKIKDKINAPPSHPDAQDIPKSLSRIMELKDKVKSGYYYGKSKKNVKKVVEVKKVVKPVKNKGDSKKAVNIVEEKPIPEFKQRPGENDRHFLLRVNRICQSVQREAAFEEKYGVDIKRNAETGQVEEVKKRPKDELQVLINKAKKESKDKQNKKKKKKKKDEGPKLSKSQKWQLKKNEKKNKKAEKPMDFNDFKDEVKFGEIVHAPPTLSAPRRVTKLESAPRPGSKQLLLKSMLEPKNNNNNTIKEQKSEKVVKNSLKKLKEIKNKTIDKKGKRKDLPNALRRQLDKQQKEIIEAYKQLKAKKYGS